MDALRLYARLLAASARVQWQYRFNAIMRVAAHLALNLTAFVEMWALMTRFGPLKGWTLAETAVLYGVVNSALALAQMTARGFDAFDGIIRQGEFDRVLLRPRSVALQLAARELPLHQLSRLAQGAGILAWGLCSAPGPVHPAGVVLILFAIGGAVCLLHALMVVQATACFWTVEGIEIFNVLIYGGTYVAEYPLTCYRPVLRLLVLYVVPITLVTYAPCLWALGKAHDEGWRTPACWCAPLAGVAAVALAAQVWRLGLRRYVSTGS